MGEHLETSRAVGLNSCSFPY